jgi:hypothetical protein
MASASPAEETTFSFSKDAPEPRREQARRLTTLRVGAITIRGERELCLIRNVSGGGLRAHVHSAVSVGEGVSVELKTNQQTRGTVSWVDDNVVGIAFDSEIDVEDLLASQSATDGIRPRMPRVEADRLGQLRIGARLFPVNTCDISQGGVRLEIDHPLEPGQNVVLTLEKFRPVPGVVRWYGDSQAGIAFNQVIPFKELMDWLRPH